MFKKILIANRGAIACRIIRTLKNMGISSVAIYAEADRDSLHVEQADEAFFLGHGNAIQTYLDQKKIIDIAKTSGAEAIHPGYGFLSENPDFVKLCNENRVIFIGPSINHMEAFALKHNARRLAQKNQIPLVPGTDLLEDKKAAVRAAQKIGYPVMLKSSAGGGGIGMQVCTNEMALENAFDSVVRLSQNNFADGSVFLEKYIEHARHVEVQIFGNGKGVAIDLGTRDCSLQRRNQKVIEEAPAPQLSDMVRQALHNTASRLLASVKYASAGTVEFIYDPREEQFYFLEVNTRLQVEHGVTEEVFGVDLVEWMIEQAWSPIENLSQRRALLAPRGHAIQARVYAENPSKSFQPSAGFLSHVTWSMGTTKDTRLRTDTWIVPGTEVSPYFDPMLAKIIAWAPDRETATNSLRRALTESLIYGIETNLEYCGEMLNEKIFRDAAMFTRFLDTWTPRVNAIEVLSPGTMTTIQDFPGRSHYWEVGVPPSGPFDTYSFTLGNKYLENTESCAGLEITVSGPTLKFYSATQIIITGADIDIVLDGKQYPAWSTIDIKAGQTLSLGKIQSKGARAYLLIRGGIECPAYLGSKSTFTLGRFGGHVGRALKTGDVIKFSPLAKKVTATTISQELRPRIENSWVLNVIYGPHGAPDFFTSKDIITFFDSEWVVHYNSSRTGIRLIGPKPEWARETGGEAGMHPSNIHDNAYAFGTVDFTGDMPVILGPDGPSLGGFVCPATVINADLWKLGQLRAGDKIRFNPVSITEAVALDKKRLANSASANTLLSTLPARNCIISAHNIKNLDVIIRAAGDRFLLIEFGKQQLDLRLRFQVYALREYLNGLARREIVDLTPGIRSLQIHYNPHQLPLSELLAIIEEGL